MKMSNGNVQLRFSLEIESPENLMDILLNDGRLLGVFNDFFVI